MAAMMRGCHHGDTENTERPLRERGSLLAEETTERVIGAAIDVHRELGPGLLESAYQACLCHELELRAVDFEREVPLPVAYKGVSLDAGYEMDIVVEDTVVLELKSVDKLHPIHEAQLMTYLRLSRKRVGLLINFNVPVLKNGIVRRVR